MILMAWTRIESAAYWICFVVAFLGIAVWESFQPKRELSVAAERRWRNHGALFVIAVVSGVLLIRVSPVMLSVMVSGSRFGVLNKPWLPLLVRFAIAVTLLDMLQYWIHWSFHHVPWLWRVHQVHHSDPDYDVSTAARFHPAEVLCSQGVHLGAIALLAPPPAAVLVATLLTVTLNFSVHANASLPARIERMLRFVFVTPDLHRIHHSLDLREQQRNLGQTFPWWDRFFGTYTAKASAEDGAFRTGLEGLENCDSLGIGFMLMEPFRNMEQKEPGVNPEPLASVETTTSSGANAR
jgi:sterol desaturase/sphingolipid hydroxylase (fatty acid hydroxylase superfamily)